jgi:hypothetical protein
LLFSKISSRLYFLFKSNLPHLKIINPQIINSLRKNIDELHSDFKGDVFFYRTLEKINQLFTQQIYLVLPYEVMLEFIVKNIYLISLRIIYLISLI